MVELTAGSVALLAATGLAAGFIDTIAGGGGLLTLPVLLSVGLNPAQALATNKLQSIFGTASSSLNFIREKWVVPSQVWLIILCTFSGAAVGATLVQLIDSDFLIKIVPFFLLAVAVYFMVAPKVGDQDAQQRISQPLFALSAGAAIGFYDGFFGPGTGSFFVIAFVWLLGFNLIKATAHTKVMNLASNAASVLFFALGGNILWKLGLAMSIGQIAGAYLGSVVVIQQGAKIIRPFLAAISIAITVRLIARSFGQ